MTQMTETVFVIRNLDGNPLAEHVRIDDANGEKRYIWRLPGSDKWGLQGLRTVDLPLYRMHECKNDPQVIITEGERACDSLHRSGYAVCATVCGASSTPSDSVLQFFAGKSVYLFPDNDDVGRAHMDRIAAALLRNHASAVYMLDSSFLPLGGDAVELMTPQYGGEVAFEKMWEAARRVEPKNVVHTAQKAERVDANSAVALYREEAHRVVSKVQKGEKLALSWGIPTLDRMTGGMRNGLICLHGSPGVGKSAVALQIAAHVPALYVSAEMSVLELLSRLVAHTTQTPKAQIMSGYTSEEEEVARLERALNIAKNLKFVDAASSPYTATEMSDDVAAMRKDHEHVLLVVDSLHSWAMPIAKEDASEYDAVNRAITALRTISNKHKIPVLFLAERNRSSMKDGGLSAVAGSRRAEYGSDMVLALDHVVPDGDEDALSVSDDAPREVVLRVLKSRWSAPGAEIRLIADLSVQTFTES